MLKVLALLLLAVGASTAAPCTATEFTESLASVANCSSTLAMDFAKIGLNVSATCETSSPIFNTWTECIMKSSRCSNGALRSAISTTVAIYSTILPECDSVLRPFYTSDFVLSPIPGDFKEFADADVNGTFPSQIYDLCVNTIEALGYNNALGQEWCGGADVILDDLVQVVVDRAFDQIKVVITPPAKGANFVPPLSEISTITVMYTAMDGRRSAFGPASTFAYRAAATYTDVEVITTASTESPKPSSQKGGGLSNGAIAGIAVAGVLVLAVVFMIGKSSGNKGSTYEKKPILG